MLLTSVLFTSAFYSVAPAQSTAIILTGHKYHVFLATIHKFSVKEMHRILANFLWWKRWKKNFFTAQEKIMTLKVSHFTPPNELGSLYNRFLVNWIKKVTKEKIPCQKVLLLEHLWEKIAKFIQVSHFRPSKTWPSIFLFKSLKMILLRIVLKGENNRATQAFLKNYWIFITYCVS